MSFRRSISRFLFATRVGQSKAGVPGAPFDPAAAGRRHPNPAASSKSSAKWEAYTKSFFGMHPTLTQVPPRKRSSATATRAP